MNKTRQKRIVRIALFLSAGAVLSVGVAFACAMLSSMRHVQRRPAPAPAPMTIGRVGEPPGWNWSESRGFGLQSQYAYFIVHLRPGELPPTHEQLARKDAPWWVYLPDERVRLMVDDLNAYFERVDVEGQHAVDGAEHVYSDSIRYSAIASGWPLPCLRGTTIYDSWPFKRTHYGVAEYSGRWPRQPLRRSIPYIPEWRGLAANTAFYGAAIALFAHGPGLARSRLRRRRALCTKCTYDLQHAASPVCPECGRKNNHG